MPQFAFCWWEEPAQICRVGGSGADGRLCPFRCGTRELSWSGVYRNRVADIENTVLAQQQAHQADRKGAGRCLGALGEQESVLKLREMRSRARAA